MRRRNSLFQTRHRVLPTRDEAHVAEPAGSTGTLHWPAPLSPHATTEPSLRRATRVLTSRRDLHVGESARRRRHGALAE